MPNKAEHPRTLANELVFIANNKKLVLTPINYYIVSADKRRQKAIREALLQSLSMNSWIDTSYYKSVSLDTKGGKYDPAMGELDCVYFGECDYPIVLSIKGDGIQPQDDETLNSFVETMVKYKDENTTIIESKFFDENMMKDLIKDKLILETINKRKLWLVAICVLMLYSYYGIWNISLMDRLMILSKKLINLYKMYKC